LNASTTATTEEKKKEEEEEQQRDLGEKVKKQAKQVKEKI